MKEYRWAGLFVAVFVLLAGTVSGQTPTRAGHAFGIGAGAYYKLNHDDQASPLHYDGYAVPVVATHQFSGRNNRFGASVLFARHRLTSQITSEGMSAQRGQFVDVQLRYLRRVLGPAAGATRLYAGLLADQLFDLRRHRYTPTSYEYVGIYFLSLEAEVQAVHSFFGGGELSARAAAPLAAYVIRPPYALKGAYSGRIDLWDRFGHLSAGVAYMHPLSNHFSAQISGALSHYRAEEARAVRDVQLISSVSLFYTL